MTLDFIHARNFGYGWNGSASCWGDSRHGLVGNPFHRFRARSESNEFERFEYSKIKT